MGKHSVSFISKFLLVHHCGKGSWGPLKMPLDLKFHTVFIASLGDHLLAALEDSAAELGNVSGPPSGPIVLSVMQMGFTRVLPRQLV